MGWGGYGDGGWPPYVSAAEKRARGRREVARLNAAGHVTAPVVIEGRKIAHTFWGQAWCENLESYGDYANRLPRGRTYVRNGSVLDLQVAPGKVTALVSGSMLYRITVTIAPLARPVWTTIARECSGKIDSVIELLAGRLSRGVMEVVSRKGGGLFPSPKELTLSCSCPDYAGLCKHVAAALYGIGARLDAQPELLFTLREVDASDLVAGVDAGAALGKQGAQERVLSGRDLSSVFGIELDGGEGAAAPAPKLAAPKLAARKQAARKLAARKQAARKQAAPKKAEAASRKAVPKAARKKAARKKGAARPVPTLTAQDLIARGVPRPTIQGWLRQGVLEATDARGVYRVTPEAQERLAGY